MIDPLASRLIETPVGPLLLVASGLGVRALVFIRGEGDPLDALSAVRAGLSRQLGAPVLDDDVPLLARAERILGHYFAGRAREPRLPLDIDGTSFQRRVWSALQAIPPGTTASYHALAAEIGRPDAIRAVANACARNPVPILIPCHRVIGADGNLRGYLGGIEAKRRLLALERRMAPDLPLLALVPDPGDVDSPFASLGPLAPTPRSPAPTRDWRGDPIDERWLTAVIDGEPLDVWPSRAEAALAAGAARIAAELLDAWVAEQLALLAPDEPVAVTPDAPGWDYREAAATGPTWPDAGSLGAFIRTAAQLGSPAVERLGHALAATAELPEWCRATLASHYERVMSGALPAPRHIREAAVDLWLELDPAAHEAALRGLWPEFE